MHLPHPKDPTVLIPARNYAEDLLRDVRSEWIRTFEALGAKRIVIGDSTALKGKLGGSKNVAGVGNVGVEMQATYGTSAVDDSAYVDGTFDPERAMENRRWIRDFPDILNIVEGRVRGTQSSWRRTVAVNASFGVSIDALAVFKGTGGFEYERTYDFFVEFHPKP